jgi:metal-sulfur cluster biosynthetic enzyme
MSTQNGILTPQSIEASTRAALTQVMDPEIGENIMDLGLVYGIEVDENLIEIALTMTSPACPMGEMILDEIDATLTRLLPPDLGVYIRLVWESPREVSAPVQRSLTYSRNGSIRSNVLSRLK